MTQTIQTFARRSLWTLPIWAGLLFAGTLTEQPDPQTAFEAFAAYVTTSQFLWSHLIGSIAGAALGSIGVVGLMLYLQDTRGAGKAVTGMVATLAGNILMASVYGVATFAEPGMGRLFQAGQRSALDFYNQAYAAPLFGTALAGMLLFIVGGVTTGMAILAGGRSPRWAGWVYAMTTVAFALGLFFPPVVQNVSSALLTITTLIVAVRANWAYVKTAVQAGISQEI